MAQQQFQGELGVSRIVLRATDAERRSVTRKRARVHREQHQELIALQRRYQRPACNLQAHRDRLATETLAQPVRPALDRLRAMRDDATFVPAAAGALQAN